MRFIINGRIDIRPLASQDKTNIPLPYDNLVVSANGSADDGEVFTTIFKATDDPVTSKNWGEGLDFYPQIFYLGIQMDVDFQASDDDGLRITLHVESSNDEFLFAETLRGTQVNPVVKGASWFLNKTYYLQISRVLSTEDLYLSVYNNTGFNLDIILVKVIGSVL